ncbi:carbohydrate kinase [Streptomyces sp. NPDC002055]|uniref:carbohydrate kinase family protein n=1 Tax=Streptomyces sp. NPDC002055 TaxID=3154534 RepID=UPI003324D0A4
MITVIGESLVDRVYAAAPLPEPLSSAVAAGGGAGGAAGGRSAAGDPVAEGGPTAVDDLAAGARAAAVDRPVAGARGSAVDHPGGSPANVAVGLARLGAPVTLITQLGEDANGRLLRDHLAASAVPVTVAPGPATATSTATAFLDAQGAARYDFRVTWDLPAPPDLPTGTRCLHTGSLATALDPGAEAIEELLTRTRAEARGITISLDPNVRPALLPARDTARARIERQVALADIVKVSEEDVAWLYPEQDVTAVARRWQRTGPALVVVTLGGAGSLAVTATHTVRRPAPSITVADTVGAGDAFTAGMLHWLDGAELLGGTSDDAPASLRTLGPDELAALLDLAATTAALTCTRPGANPPTRGELEDFRQMHARW